MNIPKLYKSRINQINLGIIRFSTQGCTDLHFLKCVGMCSVTFLHCVHAVLSEVVLKEVSIYIEYILYQHCMSF